MLINLSILRRSPLNNIRTPYVDHTCVMFLQNTYMYYACQNTLVIVD